MNQTAADTMREEIAAFALPSYMEIPNVGLFLEQVSKYISEYTEPLGCVSLTGSMISNYVKKKLLRNPIRKQYDREQIALLFFIAIAKTVLALEDIQLMLELMEEYWTTEQAYEYFRTSLGETLEVVCISQKEVTGAEAAAGAVMSAAKVTSAAGTDSDANEEGPDYLELKVLLQKVLLAVAHKVYLDKSFLSLRDGIELNK